MSLILLTYEVSDRSTFDSTAIGSLSDSPMKPTGCWALVSHNSQVSKYKMKANLLKHLHWFAQECVWQICLRQPEFVGAVPMTTLWWDLCQCGLVVLVSHRWLTVLQVSSEFLYSTWKEEEWEKVESDLVFLSSAILEHLSPSVATTVHLFLLYLVHLSLIINMFLLFF